MIFVFTTLLKEIEMNKRSLMVLAVTLLCSGCASDWKVQGGPAACEKMCEKWGLEFTAMVGVGNQDRTGEGATACVCQPKDKRRASLEGAASSSTSLAAPIVAAEEAAAAAAQAAAAQAAAAQAAQLAMQRQMQPAPGAH